MLSSNIQSSVSMVTNDKIMMSSVLQILKNLIFKSSVLIIPQIMLIFSLQENTSGAPELIFDSNLTACGCMLKLLTIGNI